MPTVTVSRADLTTDEVATVLREGLGDEYHVLPGMAMGQFPFQGVHEGRPNTIVVGTGDDRMYKTQVTITPRDGATRLRIRPSGFTLTFVINSFGIAHEVRKVLARSYR
jgi:hypothetical protein